MIYSQVISSNISRSGGRPLILPEGDTSLPPLDTGEVISVLGGVGEGGQGHQGGVQGGDLSPGEGAIKQEIRSRR